MAKRMIQNWQQITALTIKDLRLIFEEAEPGTGTLSPSQRMEALRLATDMAAATATPATWNIIKNCLRIVLATSTLMS
jgi:hypothetical protein